MAKTKDEKERDKIARKTKVELAQTLDNSDGIQRIMNIAFEQWKETRDA